MLLQKNSYFYPRPPRGGRLNKLSTKVSTLKYFYPRPPRGGRLAVPVRYSSFLNFYPRPPRGGRHQAPAAMHCRWKISIHALREEGDQGSVPCVRHASQFLSTPSARRATFPRSRHTHSILYFYPRPPRGGRRNITSIAAIGSLFLSTPSARRATNEAVLMDAVFIISIHALREEGDQRPARIFEKRCYFYPRPPRGGRLAMLGHME